MRFLYLVLLLVCSSFANSDTQTYQREYTYKASESDSKLSSRKIAMEEVRLELLRELGTQIYSRIDITNQSNGEDNYKQEILETTAGIVKTRVLDEKWNGSEYYLMVELFADPEEVFNSLQKYSDLQEQNKELANKLKGLRDTPEHKVKANYYYSEGNKLWFKKDGNLSDKSEALELYKKAARSGHIKAQHTLGNAYKGGDGIEKDLELAEAWYKKSATAGYTLSQFSLGLLYQQQGKKEAINWLTLASEGGNEYAKFALGQMYESGELVPLNIDKAIYWFEKSDTFLSWYALGEIYSDGDLVPFDHDKAKYWYTKAAMSGDADSQLELGYLYMYGSFINSGKYVPISYKAAVYWFEKASKNETGISSSSALEAAYKLALLYRYGGEDLEIDYKKSFIYTSQAAAGGHLKAQVLLSALYSIGQGTDKNQKLSKYWLNSAAESGDEDIRKMISSLLPGYNFND